MRSCDVIREQCYLTGGATCMIDPLMSDSIGRPLTFSKHIFLDITHKLKV